MEFARESGDQRITLVICENVELVSTLWALLGTEDLQAAIAALANREGITKRIATDIGYVDAAGGNNHEASADDIAAWARDHGLDGVVWTNLPCGLRNSRRVMPSVETVVDHLNALNDAACASAREYVEQAPAQVDTAYRRAISAQLGWAAVSQFRVVQVSSDSSHSLPITQESADSLPLKSPHSKSSQPRFFRPYLRSMRFAAFFAVARTVS